MCGNRFPRLLVAICIGCLLLTTACSKYIQPTLGNSGSNGDLVNKAYPYRFDWSKSNLCAVYDKETELCVAIEMGDIALLNLFLGYIQSDPVKYPPKKVTCLIAGCGNKTIRGMKMPLLVRAVVKGDLYAIDLLFKVLCYYDLGACEQVFSFKFGAGKYTIFHQAVESANAAMVAYLVNKYIEIKARLGVAHSAALGSLVEVLNIRNSINITPLDLAFVNYFRGFPQSGPLLQYLVVYGDPWSQIKLRGKSMLYAVAHRGDRTMLAMMLNAIKEGSKKIANRQYTEIISKIVHLLDEHGRTLLYHAVKHCNYDAVTYLMELGSDATCFDKNGVSPLFLAIGYCDLDMVQLLLDKKFPGNGSLAAHINKQGRDGLTALNFSVKPRNRVVVSELLRLRNARAKYSDDEPFDGSIGSCDPQIVEALLGAGADPSLPDDWGKTPLHRAAEWRVVCLVELLLNAGANALVKDLKGYTPLDVAVQEVRIRPSKGYNKGRMLKIIVKMLNRCIQKDGSSSSCVMRIYSEVISAYKYDNDGRQRHIWEESIGDLFEMYGLPTQTTVQLRGIKRPCNFGINLNDLYNKAPKRKSVRLCDGSSSGQTHGT